MRILVYWQNLGFRTETFIFNEIDYLSKKGYEVLVLSPQRFEDLDLSGINYRIVKHYEHPLVGKSLKMANSLGLGLKSFAKELKSIIAEFKPDLFHIHFGTIAVRVLDQFEDLDLPLFVSFHGYDASSELRKAKYLSSIQRICKFSNVHAIICSHFLANNLKKAGVVFKHQNILPYGVELGNFARQSYEHSKKPFTFVQVSSLNEKKGHIYTLQAFKKLTELCPNEAVELVFTGAGEPLEDLKKFAEDLGIEQQVRFVGWVNIQEAEALLESANAFVHHSIVSDIGDTEGMPNAIIEAMAMELPVISTFHAGIPEVVVDGEHGYLVEERDVDSYAQKMKAILDWDYLPKSRKHIEAHFSKPRHGEKLLEIYKKVLA